VRTMTSYEKLEARFRQRSRLEELQAISYWDEAVVMPSGSGESRAQALAELSLVIQNLLSEKVVGDWIHDAEATVGQLSPWQRANLAEIKRLYIKNTAVSPELNQRRLVADMRCQQAWRTMRMNNDWKGFQPLLQESLNLNRETLRELSGHVGLSVYDTALSFFSKGLTTEIVEKMFGELKSFLPALIPTVVEKQKREPVLVPEGKFPMAAQKALGLELMKVVNFNLDQGRLDESHHPFCGGTPRDVRITTRYYENEFVSSLMGVLHETGHALYEQNLPREWVEQPVGSSCGMAIHESQSLLMEMQVVRSTEFLEFAAPLIRKHLGPFVSNAKSLETTNLVRLVSRVKPDYIRVEADEVTYPSHVILRFEIERDLLEDRWPLSELPTVWNQKMKEYLGLSTLGNDKDGCMQDVHWPSGMWGYFPAYTFGAVIAAQLFAKVSGLRSGLGVEISRGDFTGLQSWLRANIWSQGSLVDTLQLVERAAGPLSTGAFRAHIERRYHAP
jgi:carboxypeptidase Taq